MAALETGYGKSNGWGDFIRFPPVQRTALGEFLARRLDWILSSAELQGGQIRPPLFARLIEVSEWGSLSYYLGQIGARLGAEIWLSGKVKHALHYGIYTNDAYVKTGAIVQSVLKANAKKTPDLLVEDEAGRWHLFEAKGGAANYRNKAVNKGLEQLEAVAAVGPSGSCMAPKSCVCAFTTVARPKLGHSRPLRIDLVDPPGDDDGMQLLIMPDVSHLRAIILDRLVLDNFPHPVAPLPLDFPTLSVRSLAGGRIHALIPSTSAWKDRAFEALETFEHIMADFLDYLETPSAGKALLLQVGLIAADLLQRQPEVARNARALATLRIMTNDSSKLLDPSGFGLALSRLLEIDQLVKEVEDERLATLTAVTQQLDKNNWHIVDLRCSAVFISPRVRSPTHG